MDRPTTSFDELMECVTAVICLERNWNIIISCIYRTPRSKIETSNDSRERMYSNVRQKEASICGYFNIDLLNPNHHKSTEEYIDTMYSMGLLPLMNKPTRVTLHSVTFIHNIFTNILENRIKSGVKNNDISDHLPVFATYYCNNKDGKDESKIIYRRIRADKTLVALKNI